MACGCWCVVRAPRLAITLQALSSVAVNVCPRAAHSWCHHYECVVCVVTVSGFLQGALNTMQPGNKAVLLLLPEQLLLRRPHPLLTARAPEGRVLTLFMRASVVRHSRDLHVCTCFR